MKKWAAGILACVLLTVVAGCDKNVVIRKETKQYNMQSYAEGNMRAKSQGSGLNGKLLNEMQFAFGAKNVPLTHRFYAEDGRGNISYQYFIKGDPAQFIALHVFTDVNERINRINNWYGNQSVIENAKSKTMIYNHGIVSLIYTSSGPKKGKYEPEVKEIFHDLMDRMDFE